jgi:hypothetical protein
MGDSKGYWVEKLIYNFKNNLFQMKKFKTFINENKLTKLEISDELATAIKPFFDDLEDTDVAGLKYFVEKIKDELSVDVYEKLKKMDEQELVDAFRTAILYI